MDYGSKSNSNHCQASWPKFTALSRPLAIRMPTEAEIILYVRSPFGPRMEFGIYFGNCYHSFEKLLYGRSADAC